MTTILGSFNLIELLTELKNTSSGLPGGQVVRTLPSNIGGVSSFPGWGAKISHALWAKHQNINNRSNIGTNSIKT